MNIIKTTAPIPFEELKKYFEDENIVFEINVNESELKKEQLLTYLSNIDIPVKLDFEDEDTIDDLLESYFKFDLILNVESLENFALDVLIDYRTQGGNHKEFIKKNKEILDLWLSRFDILVVYNMHTTGLYEEWLNELPEVKDDCSKGINFVSLLKYPETYSIWRPLEKPIKNVKMFEEYIFKGKNLYYYWANENNPLFLFQEGILNQDISGEEYVKILESSEVLK